MEAKMFGFLALAPESDKPIESIKTIERLRKGPAYGKVKSQRASVNDWPTYRHDAMRTGTASSNINKSLRNSWQAEIGGKLTAPVAAEGLVVVSSIEDHKVTAIDEASGRIKWQYLAGGRVDSAPTINNGMVLFGCSDGRVYCLRASDGAVVWQFFAAPAQRQIIDLDQLESVWPVHGSIMVEGGTAYFAAGRSSYLDGGIRLYGLDPETGKVKYSSLLKNDHPTERGFDPNELTKIAQNATDRKTFEDPDLSDAFSMEGNITDVFVSDGTDIYMRHMRFNRECERQEAGGRHLFSTATLIDEHESHRSYWALSYADFSRTTVAFPWIARSTSIRFKGRMESPHGLMMAYDEDTIWGIRRLEDYTIFSQVNKPLGQSDKATADFAIAEEATTKTDEEVWSWTQTLPIRPRAMVQADGVLLIGGMETIDEKMNQLAIETFEGQNEGLLYIYSSKDGKKLKEIDLPSPPVWDGMAVANGSLYISMENGQVIRLSE
jgi:outer membrane protein assembly factor BamB